MMKIGELARRSGLAASRIRFYEAQGLIRPAARTEGGYRVYGEDAFHTLELLRQGQELGFSLDEIRYVLPKHPGGALDHALMRTGMQRKIAEITAEIDRLADVRDKLQHLVGTIETMADVMACDTSIVPDVLPSTAAARTRRAARSA